MEIQPLLGTIAVVEYLKIKRRSCGFKDMKKNNHFAHCQTPPDCGNHPVVSDTKLRTAPMPPAAIKVAGNLSPHRFAANFGLHHPESTNHLAVVANLAKTTANDGHQTFATATQANRYAGQGRRSRPCSLIDQTESL